MASCGFRSGCTTAQSARAESAPGTNGRDGDLAVEARRSQRPGTAAAHAGSGPPAVSDSRGWVAAAGDRASRRTRRSACLRGRRPAPGRLPAYT